MIMMLSWLWSFCADYEFEHDDKWLYFLMVHNYDQYDTDYDYVHNNDYE